MNKFKRETLEGCINILKAVRDEEEQDLKDTPDNIENSAAGDAFRKNVNNLDSAIARVGIVVSVIT